MLSFDGGFLGAAAAPRRALNPRPRKACGESCYGHDCRVPSYANDARHAKLATVLVPLVQRTCPQGAGGYGGSYWLYLTVKEVEDLGGLDIIRSAMRKVARDLGWVKLQTYGVSNDIVMVGVVDRRKIPEPYAAVVQAHRLNRQRDMNETLSRMFDDGKMDTVPGSVYLMTQEFRAAYADAGG